ncbi:MAG: tRNA pseudouridine synthase Pus10 [Methanomassiliicoccales archaeon PtaU1.Bin124]|nr:MAG: tRNA pseudouridine synthase Pus10 [Methanomassiliicoccales archaeon PtaU1.Bin124]
MSELLDKAEIILSKHDLCDHCLGRVFARVSTGLSDDQRGLSLRLGLNFIRVLDDKEPYVHSSCYVCEEIFDNVPRFAQAAADALSKVEYNNFLVGTRVDPLISEREEQIWSLVGQEKAEPIKAELNREIGKATYAIVQKEVEFDTPDVVALIDTRFAHVEIDVAPVFVYGRYRKLSRELPQTYWPCRECRGKGCKRCNGTGKMYQTSVQEYIGEPIRAAAEGVEHFLHGMGREDIDARMLGTGRPFVIEIRDPRKRNIDLIRLKDEINRLAKDQVEVSDLRLSNREEVRKVKLADPRKTYEVKVQFESPVEKKALTDLLDSFHDLEISQQTPTRVAHRRADLERKKTIISAHLVEFEGDIALIRLMTQSGTYVKEFVHGDNGRTDPSLSKLLGVQAKVLSLDVTGILDEPEPERIE